MLFRASPFHLCKRFFTPTNSRYNPSNTPVVQMTPTEPPDIKASALNDEQYEAELHSIRKRIIDFAITKLGTTMAEDIAQECMVLLLEKYPYVRDRAGMIKVAITIARNKIWECFRQKKRIAEMPEERIDDADIHRELERPQVADHILRAIVRLGEKCRSLLKLKLLEEKGSADIQRILGVNSINTIYTWERRCFKQLIEILGGTLYVRTD